MINIDDKKMIKPDELIGLKLQEASWKNLMEDTEKLGLKDLFSEMFPFETIKNLADYEDYRGEIYMMPCKGNFDELISYKKYWLKALEILYNSHLEMSEWSKRCVYRLIEQFNKIEYGKYKPRVKAINTRFGLGLSPIFHDIRMKYDDYIDDDLCAPS